MSFLTRIADRLRGEAPSLPPLDGPYKPNRLLDEAAVVLRAPASGNLTRCGARILWSAGCEIRDITGAHVLRAPGPVTALAGDAAGRLLIAHADGSIIDRAPDGTERHHQLPGNGAITAVAALDNGDIAVTRGGEGRAMADWQRALLEGDTSGSLWRIGAREAQRLTGGLHWPAGLCRHDGQLIVAEANRHRLIAVASDAGPARVLIGDLPGYPAGITPDGLGGLVVALMAPRNQLVEFILTEPAYLRRMLQEVSPAAWIAPALAPPENFLQPMQQGAQRAHGVLKPWAPVFSQGLVLRLDAAFSPVAMAASRADGRRHGIRSLCINAGRLFVTSQASGEILSLDLPGGVS